HCNDDSVHFEIDNFQPTLGDPNVPRISEHGNTVVTARDLQLVRSSGLTTLILLDENGHPRAFSDVVDVLEYFYVWRLRIYDRRRVEMIRLLRIKAQELEHKVEFVQAVLPRNVILFLNNEDGST